MSKKVTEKNYNGVVDTFANHLKTNFKEGDAEFKKFQINWLNEVLDGLSVEDAFGTEGQNDPRAKKNHKKFAIVTKSESGDNYIYFVNAVKKPSHIEIVKFLEEHGNDIDEDDKIVFEHEELVAEVIEFIDLNRF